MTASLSRRDVLQGLSALVAAATASGCTRAPEEKIVPYRAPPRDVIPGVPSHYATANVVDGDAVGLLVESHEGRPTKVEGNPEHPASLGASRAIDQALILELYLPARNRPILEARGPGQRSPAPPAAVASALRRAVASAQPRRGRGLHVVLPPTSSPVVARWLGRLRAALPEARVYYHAPSGRARAWSGAELAFGRALEVRPDLAHADVVVLLDADPLAHGPGSIANARAFAGRRRPEAPGGMNRLYAFETTMTVSGSKADHRIPVRDSEVPVVAAALLAEVARIAGAPASVSARLAGANAKLGVRSGVHAVAADLAKHRGRGAVLVGERQPPSVHAAAHAINVLLGNIDTRAAAPLHLAPSAILDAGSPDHGGLRDLAAALEGGAVELLVTLEADVVYASSPDLRLAELWPRARESLALSLFDDATSRASTLSVPAMHLLESWGDARSFDGTTTILQPLIAPMYGGSSAVELIAQLAGAGAADANAHRLVRTAWNESGEPRSEPSFEAFWERALARGIVDGTRIEAVEAPPVRWSFVDELARLVTAAAVTEAIEVSVRPDAKLFDGRFGHNPWLQELPDPITKLTWTAAALVSEGTAHGYAIRSGDVVEIERQGRRVKLPALVVPGHADGAVTVPLGYGRGDEGAVGPSAYALLTEGASPWAGAGTLRRTGAIEDLAITQHHTQLRELADGRALSHTLIEAGAVAEEGPAKKHLSLYDTHKVPVAGTRQWGMAIDLSACTGCSACVVACQAENSTPTVGRVGVLKGREMQWIRIDRYLAPAARGETSPRVVAQPMLCQHCEKAPCEYVCPTAATVHSTDGLNQMIYNRCVGTRFCSSNCPYKVRRFNWLDYHADEDATLALAYNPEVTVRARGVMEKCTYCVQRIRGAEMRGGGPANPIADGTVKTACEQACPAGAIVFGDVSDPASRVAAGHRDRRSFAELDELGTVPRTRYLAQVTNPNPEMP